MGTSLVMAMEPRVGNAIAKADLARLESFGDNCEFGFVLRRLGFEDGMLFRWASARPESVLATLRGDFESIYEFNNLVPQNSKMVRDLHYGTSWHSQMYSSMRAGTLTFDADDEQRRTIHAREASKLSYLIEKLCRKFTHPNPVFIIKSNSGISEDVLQAIHYQLYRRVTSSRFMLLEVRDDAQRAGTVELLDRNLMRGYVARFAPYANSDNADDANWLRILALALAQNADAPSAPTPTVSGVAAEVVALPFPVGTGPDLHAPIPGDLRGGMPKRIGGSEWCRLVDDDIYRLHATGLNVDATALRWTGVHLPPGSVITIRAGYAIEESLPVCATLQVIAADGTRLRKQYVFNSSAEHDLCLTVPPGWPNPLVVSLYVEPLSPLKMGERAVIDIAPVKAVPPVS